MFNRQESTKTFVKKKLGSTLAAVALLSGASVAQAQFNSVNTFNPAGPTILQPLGGGVLSNLSLGSPFNTFTTGAGSALSTGFGSFNNGFNQGFVLPLNQPFNAQLDAFNQQRVLDTSGFSNFNTQLANFNAQRTAFNARFIQQNSALNVPNLNVPGSSNVGVFTGFAPPTATNPSLNQSAIGGSSFGFSAFNTFNAINNSTGLPVTASALSTQSFVNTQAAKRVVGSTAVTVPSTGDVIHRSGWPTPWPFPPPDQRVPGGIYMMSHGSRIPVSGSVSSGTSVPTDSNVIHRSGWVIPWPYPPPNQRVPGGIYMMGATSPLPIGGARSAFGSGSGMTVMGGHAR